MENGFAGTAYPEVRPVELKPGWNYIRLFIWAESRERAIGCDVM